jgi:hypothetical protein
MTKRTGALRASVSKSKEAKMKNHLSAKAFIFFLCVSFLVMTNVLQGRMTEAGENSLPIGQMISGGEVTYEAKENIWKAVEPSAFPLFQGTKVRTEEGVAVILLPDLGQIGVGENSLISYDQRDYLRLHQGSIDFRIQTTAEMRFGIGEISIVPSRSFQASGNPSSTHHKNEEIIGSISVHPNGRVMVRSLQGSLTVMDQGQTVLAALSSMREVTIPSTHGKSEAKVTVAHAKRSGNNWRSWDEIPGPFHMERGWGRYWNSRHGWHYGWRRKWHKSHDCFPICR